MQPPTIAESSYENALQFQALGWSVIPLVGDHDPQNPKRPALPSWRDYQRRLPVQHELTMWFASELYPAMGIVLGRVSGLLVVDIDDQTAHERFKAAFPDLLDTFTVLSGNRKLPHYYFRLEDGTDAQGRSTVGIDLRGEGQYVVAPGTRIGDCEWRVFNDAPVQTLFKPDLARLYGFMRRERPDLIKNGGNRTTERFETTSKENAVSANALRRYYQQLAPEIGRNNALFKTACFGRDRGWSQCRIEHLLTPLHRFQPSQTQTINEPIAVRDREAKATIRSVYSRPPRQVSGQPKAINKGMPNTIREWLCQHEMVNVARLLDGLLRCDVQPGDAVTVQQIYAMVREFGIGRNTVYDVLRMTLPCGSPIFETQKSPSPLQPPTPDADAAKRFAEDSRQCLSGRVAKPGKNRGRPATVYLMPSIARLCDLLNVRNKGGDALPDDALNSPSAYRAALHKALIERAPRQYPRRWLARRLGVSRDTCRRYEKQCGIRALPMFRQVTLFWHNLDKYLNDERIAGRFLQDENGKRYPALRGIARKLLAIPRRLVLMIQDINFYATASAASVKLESHGAQPHESPATWKQAPADDYSRVVAAANGQPKPTAEQPNTSKPTPQKIDKLPRLSGDVAAALKTIEPTSEDAASALYETLRYLNRGRSITRDLAKKWTDECGASQVVKAIKVVQSRQNLRNPAGFLKTLLGIKTARDERPKQSSAAWIEAFKESAYAAIFDPIEASSPALISGSPTNVDNAV